MSDTDTAELVARLWAIAAETRDCTVCDGDGVKANGNECGGCNGSGRVPVLWGATNQAAREAAARLTALERERDEAREKAGKLHDYANMRDWQILDLRAALKPFAKAADIRLCGDFRDDERFGHTDLTFHLTFGDLRRARAALQPQVGK